MSQDLATSSAALRAERDALSARLATAEEGAAAVMARKLEEEEEPPPETEAPSVGDGERPEAAAVADAGQEEEEIAALRARCEELEIGAAVASEKVRQDALFVSAVQWLIRRRKACRLAP